MDPLPVVAPPPPPVEPVFPPAPPKKRVSVLWILVILFFLAFIGLLVYQQWQIHIIQKAQSAIPSEIPTPTPDSTADWKTFTNEELRLSFKLPPALTTPGNFLRTQTPTEKGTQICWTLDQTQGLKFIKKVIAGGGSCFLNKFTLGVTSFDHEAGRMGGFADYKSFTPNSDIPAGFILQKTNPQNIETIIIKGANGPKEDPMAESGFPVNGTPGEGNIGALLKNSDPTYPVISVQMVLTNELTEETFDQILSTFTFTDQNQENEPAS